MQYSQEKQIRRQKLSRNLQLWILICVSAACGYHEQDVFCCSLHLHKRLGWAGLMFRSNQTLFQIEPIIMDLISAQQETAQII